MAGRACKKRRCTNPISRKNAPSTTMWKTERSRDECRSRRNCASRNASCALFPRCLWNEPLPGTQVSTRIKGRVQCRDAFARSGLTPEANRRIGRSRAPRWVRVARVAKNRDVSLSVPDETSHFPIGFRIRISIDVTRGRERETRSVHAQTAERTGHRPLVFGQSPILPDASYCIVSWTRSYILVNVRRTNRWLRRRRRQRGLLYGSPSMWRKCTGRWLSSPSRMTRLVETESSSFSEFVETENTPLAKIRGIGQRETTTSAQSVARWS